MRIIFMAFFIMLSVVACGYHDVIIKTEKRSPSVHHDDRLWEKPRMGLIEVDHRNIYHLENHFEKKYETIKGYCIIERGRRMYGEVYEIRWFRKPYC